MTSLMWPIAGNDVRETALGEHRAVYGRDPGLVAVAPATFSVIGEHTDVYGGIVLTGVSARRVVVTASRRPDDAVRVRVLRPGVDGETVTVTASTTMEDLAAHANRHQAAQDTPGGENPPSPLRAGTDDWANRLGGVAWMMIHRQLISREIPGFDVTVVSDIPPGCGLGGRAAAEAAFALGLADLSGHHPDPPLRARVADICTQAAALFGDTPPLRARHTTALRGGTEQVLSVIDYADGSVTHAPSPAPLSHRPYLITVPRPVPGSPDDRVPELRRREEFITLASRIYGVESLRLLPDAEERVIDWLETVHEVKGGDGQPAVAEASGWMGFLTSETRRAADCAAFLRSRRTSEALDRLARSQSQTCAAFGLGAGTEALVRLCLSRGAAVARAAHAGASDAVIAWFPADGGCDADDAALRLADDGLLVIPLSGGGPATVDDDPDNWM
ncbi:galactokinase family protein [Corynebacterium pygosceleis]|uniref:Galactokinase n=1 Tax=Corynebacterium pygosceleis TaxID=2800406 RepID=A0A9Q4GHN8_9CORY|nr:galactokinase family protein [Corynebacterium pygosceleis]MCK7636578.1 galactokinase [Corynebacterium pygosceleis]MCK7675152.1 galactokinase [Corynebacterium pygosceleis]MCL0120631.1 galactokinase [Corynebacterium pygosceleis]MCX7467331.1 galactokinase [Corynebacterium pygosceleis]